MQRQLQLSQRNATFLLCFYYMLLLQFISFDRSPESSTAVGPSRPMGSGPPFASRPSPSCALRRRDIILPRQFLPRKWVRPAAAATTIVFEEQRKENTGDQNRRHAPLKEYRNLVSTRWLPPLWTACRGCNVHCSNLLVGITECASLPLPGTGQREREALSRNPSSRLKKRILRSSNALPEQGRQSGPKMPKGNLSYHNSRLE